MKSMALIGRVFYSIALIGIAIQQIYYANFCPILFPSWPNFNNGYHTWAYLFSIALIIANVFIIIGYKAKITALILAAVMLMMLLFGHIPFEYIVIPYKKTHLALWVLPLKELALAGGAFCIAGSLVFHNKMESKLYRFSDLLIRIIPYGHIFFSITMICFGITHFLYTKTVADMVPLWIPAHYFWTYFAGVVLIGSGISIITGICAKISSFLLGVMIFLWFILLHLPSAIRFPLLNSGNEVYSAFSALAFSGIALVISYNFGKRKLQDK